MKTCSFLQGFILSGFLKLIPTKARLLNPDDGTLWVPPLIYAVFSTMILPSISLPRAGRPGAQSDPRSRLARDHRACILPIDEGKQDSMGGGGFGEAVPR